MRLTHDWSNAYICLSDWILACAFVFFIFKHQDILLPLSSTKGVEHVFNFTRILKEAFYFLLSVFLKSCCPFTAADRVTPDGPRPKSHPLRLDVSPPFEACSVATSLRLPSLFPLSSLSLPSLFPLASLSVPAKNRPPAACGCFEGPDAMLQTHSAPSSPVSVDCCGGCYSRKLNYWVHSSPIN